jgi:chromosome segregation protein
MRLKSIEIKGFKSFADKTVINFDNNITGVVGPNGCGKSNVVDAIRWVLGEQKSKSLRLEKMDNIIFNGTKERHAANIAEVSLSLDNTRNLLPTEYGSVTITRVIHRDGDSEYRLNGITCRLKDIRDLFMDTGISTDTYAIIELKMIDEILNDLDNARRRLIEQAAGVSKYKTRKRETLLKLTATEGDLSRVEDILFEIEKNLKALESQAKKARQYKNLREEYRQLSIDLAKYDLLEINSKYEVEQNTIQAHEDRKVAIDATISNLEAALQQDKKMIVDKERSLSEQQKSVNEVVNTIQQLEADKRIAQQKLQFLKEKTEQLEKQKQQAVSSLQHLDQELSQVHFNEEAELEKLQNLQLQRDNTKSKVDEQRNDNLTLRERLEKARQDYQNARQQLYAAEKQIAVKQTELDGLLRSAQQSLFENEERQKQLQTLQAEVNQFNSKIETQKALISDLEVKEAAQVEKTEELEQLLEKSRNELTAKNRILDAKNNEYKLTKNMIDNLEGFPDAIKFLKKKAGWLKSTPLLTDIIYTEEKYRAALETVLQPWLNHFIVQEENEAGQAILMLQQGSVGKAGFLLSTSFESHQKDETPAIEGLLRMIDIIEVDEAYQSLLNNLLSNIYLAPEDFALDQSTFPEGNSQAQIVSQSGNLLRSKGSWAGGAVGLFEGKRLGRLKNLEKLDAEIKVLDKEVLDLKKQVQDTQSSLQQLKNNSLKRVIEREHRDLQELEKNFVSKKSRIDNFQEIVQKSIERQAQAQNNILALQESIAPVQDQLNTLKVQVDELALEAEYLEEAFRKASEQFSKQQEHFNQQHILFLQQENHLKAIRQNFQYKQQQKEQFQIQITQNSEEIQRSQAETTAISTQLQNTENQLVTAYQKKEGMLGDLSSFETEFFNQRDRILHSEELIRDKQHIRTEIDKDIVACKDRLNDLKVKVNVLKERFSFEFKLDISDLLDTIEAPETPFADLQERMEKVKKRIDNFGEVNPMAEEAYNEMRERYDFITEQKNDLVAAKESLLETIKEIDNTAQEQFLSTFTAVRENFIQVFRSMFTQDDNCDLIIVNPEDPLESEIDIVAKPKGKRPQSINQLSGGEKTLTALSLLFALYLYKPAPFCILDEVDAPLDDTNIKKFNDAIRRFSSDSQFIIVTHNKSTMAAVDAIYGVTMIKQGISRVVPVDFSAL